MYGDNFFLEIVEKVLNKYYDNSHPTSKHDEIYYFDNIIKLLYILIGVVII